MGHEIPDPGAGKIGWGKGLKVVKQAIPKPTLNPSSRSQQKKAPHVAKGSDSQGKTQDLCPIDEEGF